MLYFGYTSIMVILFFLYTGKKWAVKRAMSRSARLPSYAHFLILDSEFEIKEKIDMIICCFSIVSLLFLL